MIEFLRKVSLFRNLSPAQLQNIESICSVKQYKTGTILFRENEPGNVFYIIISGSVKIFISNQLHEEKILSVFTPGETFGELSLIDRNPRSASAQTLEDTEMLTLVSKDFIQLVNKNVDILLNISAELSKRLREANQQIYDLTFSDARTRIVKSLVRLSRKHGTRSGDHLLIHSKLHFGEISQMAGVSNEMLAQVFRDLQNKKILHMTESQLFLDLSRLK